MDASLPTRRFGRALCVYVCACVCVCVCGPASVLRFFRPAIGPLRELLVPQKAGVLVQARAWPLSTTSHRLATRLAGTASPLPSSSD